MEHALLPEYVIVPLVGQATIAKFQFVNKLVITLEIVLFQIHVRVKKGGKDMIARFQFVHKIVTTTVHV